MGGAVAELGFVKHHAGKEGAEGKRDIKQLHGAEGDAQRQASTDRVNSSREPVAALRDMIHGTSRRPTSIIMAIKATTLPMVILRSRAVDAKPTLPSPPYRQSLAAGPASGPSPGLPQSASRWRFARAGCQSVVVPPARSSTTVLAVERHRPKTMPVISDQPRAAESAIPSSVATAIWAMAPGMAIDFTAIRSLSEKCSPTPNISRMTPSSASSGASLVSATKPGERSGQHAR